jgi:hypothetical protein
MGKIRHMIGGSLVGFRENELRFWADSTVGIEEKLHIIYVLNKCWKGVYTLSTDTQKVR